MKMNLSIGEPLGIEETAHVWLEGGSSEGVVHLKAQKGALQRTVLIINGTTRTIDECLNERRLLFPGFQNVK